MLSPGVLSEKVWFFFFFFFKFLRSEVGGEAHLSPVELKKKKIQMSGEHRGAIR